MQQFQTFYSCNHSHFMFIFNLESITFTSVWQKQKTKTNSQFSWILSLLISALGSLLSGSTLAPPIGIRLPHNLIHDHWRGAGKPEKPHKMFEQDTRWQYISFHSCCMQCARVWFSELKNRFWQRIHKGVTFELKHEGIQRCIMFIFGGMASLAQW